MALLPARNVLDGSALPVTSQMKTALGSLRDYCSDLLGTDSSNKAAARTALGAAEVGANSTITSLGAIGSINGGQIGGLRNKLINGNFGINQRGVTGTVNGYALDRWIINYGGTQPTWTQSSSGVNVPWQGVTYVAITGVAGNSGVNFAQRIEAINCRDMAGQTVTASYWCYQNTGSAMTVTTGLSYAVSNDNYTSKTPISAPAGTSVPNGTWTKVTATFTVPTGATTGLELVCFSNNPAATVGIIYGLTAAQLELGSVATVFEQRPYGLELALCQRYLPVVELTNTFFRYTGQCFSTTSAQCYVPFPVQARASPTGFTASSAVTFSTAVGATTGTAIMANPTTTGAMLSPIGASGLVAGNATGLLGGASSTKIFFNGCEL